MRHRNSWSEFPTVLARLRDREINIVFAVDIFNEGVDVPEVYGDLAHRPKGPAWAIAPRGEQAPLAAVHCRPQQEAG